MMNTRDKAEKLLRKLYLMRRTAFTYITVDDILAKASAEEINFYYYMICEVRE